MQLLEYIELLRRKRYGPSAERIPDSQLRLFDETKLESLLGVLEQQLEQAQQKEAQTKATTDADQRTADRPAKRRPVRRPLPAHLLRVKRTMKTSDEQKPPWVRLID